LNENYKKLIHDSIKTIINQFHRKPDNFFNEYDFHQYFYHAFYKQKEFSMQYDTKDGKKTIVLHPEYPTLKKFRRNPPMVDKNGKRARYDMAILNPEFIKQNEFEVVRCRDISKIKPWEKGTSKNLIAAIEFKFIINHSKKHIQEIKFDNLKLSYAYEAEEKYILIFANIREKEKEIDYFKDIKRDKDIKIYYLAVFNENGKKIIIKI